MCQGNRVLVFASDRVQIAVVEKAPETILWRGEPFRAIRYGDMHGHHDWLRSDRNEIIGVRHWLLGVPSQVVDRIRGAAYSELWHSGHVIEIFFTESKAYVDAVSQDHVIGEDDIYLSTGQGVIFSYRKPDCGELARTGISLAVGADFHLGADSVRY